MRLNTEYLAWPSLKMDYFNIASVPPQFFSKMTLFFSKSGYIRVWGGFVLLGAELFDLKCHPILRKHTGATLGHPCANVTLSECLPPGIRLAMVLPGPVWLVRQSHCLPIARALTRPGSCSPRFHGIWFVTNSLNFNMLIIGWLVCSSLDVT